MIPDILVKSLIGIFFNDRPDQIEVQVTVLVAFTRCIVIVAFDPFRVLLWVEGVQCEVALRVVDGGGVRE